MDKGDTSSRCCLGWLPLLWHLRDPAPSRSIGSWVETEETGPSLRGMKFLRKQRTTLLPVASVAPTLRRVSLIDRDVIRSEESRRDDNQRRAARGLARIRSCGSAAA